MIAPDENNDRKYPNVSREGNGAAPGEKEPTSFEIAGVLDCALYEDVTFTFDVICYSEGQKEEEYRSYTMRIACNASGDARFETCENNKTTETEAEKAAVSVFCNVPPLAGGLLPPRPRSRPDR